MSPVVEHPFQGWLPYLKLVWQPSVQLLLVRSSSLSFAMTEPCAGVRVAVSMGAWVAGAVRRPARVFAVRSGLCGGLASGFGATTVTLGSVEPGVVCDIAAPVRLHSNAVDRIATAADATKLDDIVILVLPNPDLNAVPVRTPHHVSNLPFRSGRPHAPAQSQASSTTC